VSAEPERSSDDAPPYGTVAFDCDSTLSRIEGIDELAGARKREISALTERAMRGEIALEDVYAHRLELLRPARDAIRAVGAKYVAERVPFARELFEALRSLDKRVVIVSGGIRDAVLELARSLDVAERDCYAVEVRHDAHGRYAGFDRDSPLATQRGKLEVLRAIAREDRGGGVAFVGEGMTDLLAAPAVKRFIAFGGVVVRPEVFARAAHASRGPDLAALVPHLLSAREIERLSRDPARRTLLDAARAAH
jgi:phosphoserine phosphatase